MITKRLVSLTLAAGLVGLLTACANQIQTSSGSRYLEGYGTAAAGTSAPGATPRLYAGPAGVVDEEVATAARVEPQLRFPARIGLARIDRQGLMAVPPEEAESWRALAGRLGSGYGEFVPVSPLIAALATPEPNRLVIKQGLFQDFRLSLAEVVRQVRLGAARQHLDAVLIYETFGRSEESSNPLAVTKLALIGFFLPTESVEAEGFAQAVLVDVRNGYTYGTASAVAEKPSHRLTNVSDSGDAHASARREAEAHAVAALTGEVETMVRDLRLALAEQRAAPRNTHQNTQ
jgi:hypothetical protein